MTTSMPIPIPMPPAPRKVRCPICMNLIDWPNSEYVWLYEPGGTEPEPQRISKLDAVRQQDLRREGYRPCPTPEEDTPKHYLPALYGSYGDPLVIGLIGTAQAGKTHLLTRMITTALDGTGVIGVTASSMDSRRHERFRFESINRLDRGTALPSTSNDVIEHADILLVHTPTATRPVTFFDIAGDRQARAEAGGRAGRFLLGVGGLIFVHAVDDEQDKTTGSTASNEAFVPAIARVRAIANATALPAAVAVVKSDRLRYVPPVDRWLRRPVEAGIDAQRIRMESRDVYAYLHSKGAKSAIQPFEIFQRCTMHFVSASGGDKVLRDGASPQSADAYEFPRGVRSARVLEPLLAILAMAGLIDGPEAQKVGRP